MGDETITQLRRLAEQQHRLAVAALADFESGRVRDEDDALAGVDDGIWFQLMLQVEGAGRVAQAYRYAEEKLMPLATDIHVEELPRNLDPERAIEEAVARLAYAAQFPDVLSKKRLQSVNTALLHADQARQKE